MSDEKKYTERDVVQAKRRAFETGVDWFFTRQEVPSALGAITNAAPKAAEAFYPMPQVSRPRIVRDEHNVEWRMIGDVFEHRVSERDWTEAEEIHPMPSRIKLLADLAANPTEEVDAECEPTNDQRPRGSLNSVQGIR